jgi:hypothetical protein
MAETKMGCHLDDDDTNEFGTENGRKRTSFSRLKRRCAATIWKALPER